MNYETSTINANFKIKVFGFVAAGKKINTLVGVSGLVNIIGTENANKLVARAMSGKDDKCECKVRKFAEFGGLKVTFYVF